MKTHRSILIILAFLVGGVLVLKLDQTITPLTTVNSQTSPAQPDQQSVRTVTESGSAFTDPQLLQLRHQLALYYMEPESHMALAKYFLQKGERLQAFYLLEYARSHFPPAQFNQAYQRAFGGRRSQTESKQGEPSYMKGVELLRAGETKKAEEFFVRAAELSPHSVQIQSWVGRFFFKERRDDLRALQFYLNAYFLDPHAYETEFVESRIRKINYEQAMFRYRHLGQRGVAVEEILKDPNPTVIVLALQTISESWRPTYLKPLLQLMAHDDEEIRWLATEAIQKNVDRSFDETLRALLRDNDLRVRGLAAYISVHVWKQQSFDVLRDMLREEAQLLRYDAMSALILGGGNEGRRIVLARIRFESHPALRRRMNESLSPTRKK